ncbi:hypothetical protein HMPREF3152_07170 [Actinomyces sp. HMSC06A08]|nr:hypothetical protein HMPREF3152_07170 [Actinomyces sp. HMSC06A08]
MNSTNAPQSGEATPSETGTSVPLGDPQMANLRNALGKALLVLQEHLQGQNTLNLVEDGQVFLPDAQRITIALAMIVSNSIQALGVSESDMNDLMSHIHDDLAAKASQGDEAARASQPSFDAIYLCLHGKTDEWRDLVDAMSPLEFGTLMLMLPETAIGLMTIPTGGDREPLKPLLARGYQELAKIDANADEPRQDLQADLEKAQQTGREAEAAAAKQG